MCIRDRYFTIRGLCVMIKSRHELVVSVILVGELINWCSWYIFKMLSKCFDGLSKKSVLKSPSIIFVTCFTQNSGVSFFLASVRNPLPCWSGEVTVSFTVSHPPPHPPKQIIAGFYSKQDACIHYNVFFSDSLVKHDSNSTGWLKREGKEK